MMNYIVILSNSFSISCSEINSRIKADSYDTSDYTNTFHFKLPSALQSSSMSGQLLVKMESLHSSMWDKWKADKNENKNSVWILWRLVSTYIRDAFV